ncbi:MAG: chromate efflux transporter [Pseudomonadota bacterium]
MNADLQAPASPPSLATWFRIGLMSFGGPAAHISVIQQEICERQKLVDYDTYLRGLNFAVLLPGPEAVQLATYLGWRLEGTAGALKAGLGFILPGAALIILVTVMLIGGGEMPLVQAMFRGVQPVIVALVTVALFRLARSAVKDGVTAGLAVFALVVMSLFSGVFPIIILIAGALGAIMLPDGQAGYVMQEDESERPAAPWQTAYALAAGAVIWFTLMALCLAFLQFNPFVGLGLVISTAALSTFGGAYPAIAFVGDQAAHTWGWLSETQMIDGLVLAETIPGPLSLYSGYIGAMAAADLGTSQAVLAGALAICFTFLPSFTLVLAFAPYVDRLYAISLVRAALAGITAAVAGIIAKLALFLVFAVCLPENSPNWLNIMIAAAAGVLLLKERVPPLTLIAFGAVLGLLFMR